MKGPRRHSQKIEERVRLGTDFAVTQFDRAPYQAPRRTIDVSGDGDEVRDASKCSSGTWGPDDYAVVMPHLPSHGFCATRDEAKAKFAEDVTRVVGG
jgi:hypothetical protein